MRHSFRRTSPASQGYDNHLSHEQRLHGCGCDPLPIQGSWRACRHQPLYTALRLWRLRNASASEAVYPVFVANKKAFALLVTQPHINALMSLPALVTCSDLAGTGHGSLKHQLGSAEVMLVRWSDRVEAMSKNSAVIRQTGQLMG